MIEKVVGITGGIGSGKSTVTDYLKEKGYIVIDADEISKKITMPGGEALPKIRESFGDEVFNVDNSLNRKIVGKIIFADKTKRDVLNKIIHKNVIASILENIVIIKSDTGYTKNMLFLDIPLLFEAHFEKNTDEVWVIFSDLKKRIDRIVKRDNLDISEILNRINAQMTDEEREKKATHILNNSKSRDKLYKQIDDLL